MRLKSFIQIFLLPLPQYHTALNCLFPLPKEGSSIFRRQQQVRQRGRYWRSRIRFHRCVKERRPYFPNQKYVNDLIRDLGLAKSNAELLISRLKQWNLLDESVQVTDQGECHETFSNFFSRQDELCFCNNVACLFEAIGITCNPSEWRLFIFSSSRNLRAVLFHNGNNYPTLPMAHSVHFRGLHQCQDVAECLEVCRLWMGGHRRLLNGVIPYEPSRRFHEISLFPLPQRKHDGGLHFNDLGASSRKRFAVHSQI